MAARSTENSARRERCRECLERLEHCHATLVEHEDGRLECLAGEGCEVPKEAHGSVIPCGRIGCFCGAAAP